MEILKGQDPHHSVFLQHILPEIPSPQYTSFFTMSDSLTFVTLQTPTLSKLKNWIFGSGTQEKAQEDVDRIVTAIRDLNGGVGDFSRRIAALENQAAKLTVGQTTAAPAYQDKQSIPPMSSTRYTGTFQATTVLNP